MSGDNNNPLFDASSAQHLSYLASWKLWGRRPHVIAIQQQMDLANQRWNTIFESHHQLSITAEQRAIALAESEAVRSRERDDRQAREQTLTSERDAQMQISQGLQEELAEAGKRELALTNEHNAQILVSQSLQEKLAEAGKRELDLNQRYDAEKMARAQLTTHLVDTQERLKVQAMQNAATQAALENEQEQRRQLGGDLNRLEAEHAATQIRFELVSRLLAVPPPRNEGIEAFQKLLDDDYMRFASAEASLADESKALRLLQSIKQELHLMAANPDIFRRTIVGVVGGFSSGKSAFINSFLKKDFKLLSSVTPATVIPSYVYPAQQTRIQAYSFNGGCIDLNTDFYQEMSRAFVEQFSFDLKRIMPLVSIGTPMDTERTGNICLMDTPGYNPGSDGAFSENDRAVAVSHSRKSDILFWVIGIDSNGTIPQSDIEFLNEIGFEGRPVYVIMNKSDLRSPDEIEQILDSIEDEIEQNGITAEGISAYSSRSAKEISHRGKSMQTFLKDCPNTRPPMTHVEERINEVFEIYRKSITESISTAKSCRAAARAVVLDLMQASMQEDTPMRSAKKNMELIEAAMNPEALSKLLDEGERISMAFKDAAQRVLA